MATEKPFKNQIGLDDLTDYTTYLEQMRHNFYANSMLSQEFNDWYVSELDKYKDSEFYETLVNNPYLKYNYIPTFWDKIGSSSGLWHSGEDKVRQEYETKAREYYSKTLETMREQEHNSLVNQVQEQRAVGINPDLSGLPSGAGLASENDNILGVPDLSSMETHPEKLLEAGQSFMSIIMSMVGFAEGVQGLAVGSQQFISNELENDSKRIRNASQENEFMTDVSTKMSMFQPSEASFLNDINKKDAIWVDPDTNERFNLYKLFHDKEGNVLKYRDLSDGALAYLSSISFDDIKNQDNLVERSFFSSLPKQTQERLIQRMNSYRKSPEFKKRYYELVTGSEGAREELANIRSKPGYSGFDELMKVFGQAMSDLSYNDQKAEKSYNKAVYDHLIKQGVPEAEAKQRANKAKRDEADNKVFDDMRKNFMDMTKTQDKFWGYLGLLFLPSIRKALQGDK